MTDSVAFITGASAGFGRAVAMEVAAQGHQTILCARNEKALHQTADAIEAAGHRSPKLVSLDLSELTPPSAQHVAHQIAQSVGRLDALYHIAGEVAGRTPLGHYPPDRWDRIFQVNHRARVQLTQAFMPLLWQSPAPRLVMTLDDTISDNLAYWGAYAVAQSANTAYAEIVASEWRSSPQARVCFLRPQPMPTALRLQAYPGLSVSSLVTPASEAHRLLAELT